MKKSTKITTGIILTIIVGVIVFALAYNETPVVKQNFVVQRGNLEMLVSLSGETYPENAVLVEGPVELRSNYVRVNNVRIQYLVPEGTVVNRGDVVAILERTEADLTLKNLEDQVQAAEVSYSRTQIDTTITLRGLRDDMVELVYNLEERRITLDQSKFEPPATIRQEEINLERAERSLAQAQQNYILRQRQAEERMTESYINLERTRRRYQELNDVLEKFTITSPGDGMVIYYREWNGRQRTVGSSINSRDLVVATIPDLSSMMSRVYVNEIDISKIVLGQPARITIDAIPDRRYSGRVVQVSNVGQQLTNSDAKVFEVIIALNESDDQLRPAMSTANSIVTNSFNDVLYIPLEAIHINDDVPFVYTSKGTKQVVLLGESNKDYVIVEQGLEDGDQIYTTVPEKPENYKIAGEELIAVLHARKEQMRIEEERRLAIQNGLINEQGGQGGATIETVNTEESVY